MSDSLPVLLNYGGALKSSFEMTAAEFKKAAISIRNRAREKAFSKGLPVFVKRDGKIIAEFADGHFEIVIKK